MIREELENPGHFKREIESLEQYEDENFSPKAFTQKAIHTGRFQAYNESISARHCRLSPDK